MREDGDGEEPPVVDTLGVADTFATGIEWTFNLDFVRITFWAEHPMGFGPNSLPAIERQVVANIVMPTPAFERAAAKWEAIKRTRTTHRVGSH